jgi:hypothetical protein
MAGVYLGDSGHVELRRRGRNVPLNGELHPSDVNTGRRRFSFTFDPSALISGDLISIARVGGGNLVLVEGHDYPDGQWHCHVDDVGGIRLYDTFRDAINGEKSEALPLVVHSESQQIEVRAANRQYRCMAGITEWSLTTNRDATDLTVLGEEHRRFYTNGLMSGQGSLTCLWSYEQSSCEGETGTVELPHYMAQLVLRCQMGAAFLGRFYIKDGPSAPIDILPNPGANDDYIWWEAMCIATNVGMSFRPGQPIATSIEFITTGPVQLRMGTPRWHLLQEDGALLLQEDGDSRLLDWD